MDKGELEKQLKQIDEELELKRKEIENSSKYRLLTITINELYSKKGKIERELKQLEMPTYKKYINKIILTKNEN